MEHSITTKLAYLVVEFPIIKIKSFNFIGTQFSIGEYEIRGPLAMVHYADSQECEKHAQSWDEGFMSIPITRNDVRLKGLDQVITPTWKSFMEEKRIFVRDSMLRELKSM